MKQLDPGAIYIINYGFMTKLVTFVGEKDGAYQFLDDNGAFMFTSGFLAKGTVSIEEIEEEWSING